MPRQSRLWYGLAALVLAGCSSWQVQDRQNFVENCAQSLHRLRKDSYTDLQVNVYCTCLQSETEARFAPDQVSTTPTDKLPPVVVDNCARKANIDSLRNR